MKYLNFLLWYLSNEYWPDKIQLRIRLLLNKFWYFLILFIGVCVLAYLKQFNKVVQNELSDPYINSIPASVRLVKNFDSTKFSSKFQEYRFDKLYDLGILKVSNSKGRTVYLKSLVVPPKHPYLSVIGKQVLKKYQNSPEGIFLTSSAVQKISEDSSIAIPNIPPKFTLTSLDKQKINKTVSVSGITSTLPNGAEVIFTLDFYSALFNSIEIIDKEPARSEVWELSVSDSINDFDSLFFWSNLIDEYNIISKYSEAVSAPIISKTLPGKVSVNFNKRVDYKFIIEYLSGLNLFIERRSLNLESIKLHQTKNYKSVKSKVLEGWSFLTITVPENKRSNVFDLKTNLEKEFPRIKVEIKSLNTIYSLGIVKERMNLLIFFVITSFVSISILINFLTLNHHLFRRKGVIGYLKVAGVRKVSIVLIYVIESVIENFVFIFLTLSAAIMISVSYPSYFFLEFDHVLLSFLGTMFGGSLFLNIVLSLIHLEVKVRELLN